MRTSTCRILLIIPALFLIAAAGISKSPDGAGKITGTITDKATGAPVVGASVQVIGTGRGSTTDFDGKYVVAQLEPGTYTLRISHLEYNTIEVTEIPVKAGSTSEASFSMTKKMAELDKTVRVVGRQDKLQIYEVANQNTVRPKKVRQQPATTVDELLSEIQGVVGRAGEVNIRGGCAGEVSHIVDGTPVDESLGRPGPCDSRVQRVRPRHRPPYFPPAHGGTAIVNGEPFDAMFFENYGVNPFVDTEDDHFSTFAIDVDDASFIMTRSYLERGYLPDKDAVRVEEFVNHLDYGYSPPRHDAFSVYTDGAPSRFGDNCMLMRIGIKGREVRPEHRKPANLTFVIDVSGSMAPEDRLGLVKQSLRYLVDQLNPDDRVGIVTYGSFGRVLLEPTGLEERFRINRAIEHLMPGGSTNAEEGLQLGYDMANRQFQRGKINRVILCSDGVANVGRTGPDDILKQIKGYAERGITLTTVGFGMGNYNDVLMEKLGNKGNGFYAYVDDIAEARRVFVDNLTGTLEVIARDVKIQVDFNPQVVRSYRLLGYENRDVADNKFRDDKEDGGEIGAGHEVTALYEVKLWPESPPMGIGTVYIRYKDPVYSRVTEINRDIGGAVFGTAFDLAHPDLRLAAAAAEFAEILRDSYWSRKGDLADVLDVVRQVACENRSEDVSELQSMVRRAIDLKEQLAER